MSDENAGHCASRDVITELLARWTGVAEGSLAKYETEELHGYFERAADPRMCLLAGVAGLVFASGAAAAFAFKNYFTALCLLGGALLDGGAAIYRYGQLKEVRKELQAGGAAAKPPAPSCCGEK